MMNLTGRIKKWVLDRDDVPLWELPDKRNSDDIFKDTLKDKIGVTVKKIFSGKWN